MRQPAEISLRGTAVALPMQQSGESSIGSGGVMTKAMELSVLILAAVILAGCSGGSLTTREKGAGIGAVGGAAAGGIIGATVGHPGAGAAIGGALGLAAGALVGDYMQGQEQQQYQANQQQMQQNQRTIDRNNQQIQRSRQTEY
jgi:phage tail tape-measure protein